MLAGAAFVEDLRAAIEAGRAFGRHPLWLRIVEGGLPRAALRPFVVQFFLQVREFPRAVSALHSSCPDAGQRIELAESLYEEETGRISGCNVSHPELFVRFGEALDVPRDAMVRGAPLPATRALIDWFERSTRERPFIEGKSLASAATALLPRIVLGANHWLAQRRVPRTEVDRVVKEGDTITDLQVVEVPGHTPGQIALIHPGDGVVLCGDTVFNIRARLGHDPIPGITLDPRLAETSMLRVAELGYADVVPSHGPAILGDAPDRIRHFVANRRS